MVGTITPASAGCMWSRSSWRFRKYQGALGRVRGDRGVGLVEQDRVNEHRQDRQRGGEQDGRDELDEYEVWPDQQLFFPRAALPPTDCPGCRLSLFSDRHE